jgi:hypothetical protein
MEWTTNKQDKCKAVTLDLPLRERCRESMEDIQPTNVGTEAMTQSRKQSLEASSMAVILDEKALGKGVTKSHDLCVQLGSSRNSLRHSR